MPIRSVQSLRATWELARIRRQVRVTVKNWLSRCTNMRCVPSMFISMDSLSASSNLTVAAEWKTTDTSSARSSRSEAEMPSSAHRGVEQVLESAPHVVAVALGAQQQVGEFIRLLVEYMTRMFVLRLYGSNLFRRPYDIVTLQLGQLESMRCSFSHVAFQTNDWAPPDRMTGQWEVEARQDDRGGEKQKEKFLRKSKRTQDLNLGSAAGEATLSRRVYDATVQDVCRLGVKLRRAEVADEAVPVASSVHLLSIQQQLSRVATLKLCHFAVARRDASTVDKKKKCVDTKTDNRQGDRWDSHHNVLVVAMLK
ncbi:Swi5-dependent recombination DNA repair protein 1-like protein [Frankliniella fusca]|uniref:Swi5-dependent recombination DNA repair protein 1-like protein n=1 Tax=Frankliniella fusca TaxID=407009 RepID=A0AAE1GQY9_9NEOP|nr:Swi5-dependent recombination DNA repair protein 1-like protein [Frankliniella fusca]